MAKVKLTITKSRCRGGYVKEGDTFIVEDICPPLCHEIWNGIYPYVFALQNNAVLDYGKDKSQCFSMRCPDEGRVEVFGELIQEDEED